ncbi:MAG: polysaccharide biosynthesis protein [Lachnospiraceae bacterium]|nr:polysaccharide biosynthesis protein [Lachnospiraceae bacterium]
MKDTIGKSAVVLTISKVLTMLIGLASAMMLSRFRTLEEYGTYSQLLVATNVAVSIFTLGLPNSVNFFLVNDDAKERRRFLSVYYTLSTIICVIMGVALVCAVPLLVFYFENPQIEKFAYFLALFPWTSVIIASMANVMVVYKQIKKLMLLNAINSFVALFAILLVQIAGWSFQEYMKIYLLGEIIITICIYVIVNGFEGRLNFLIDIKLVKDIFRYSIPIGLASILGTINIELDKLMIGKLYDTESLAIYANAGKELPLTIIASSFTAVLLPRMAKKIKEKRVHEAIELWGKTVELSFIFMGLIVSMLIVFAPQIVTVLYSEKYLPGVGVFRVYAMVLLLRITYFGMILSSMGKTKSVLYSSLMTLGVNTIFNLLLYKVLGFEGPAFATFISITVAGVTQLKETSKVTGISFIKIFPWKKLIYHAAINCIFGIVCYILLNLFNVGVGLADIGVCVIAALFWGLVYILFEKKCVVKLWRELNGDKE